MKRSVAVGIAIFISVFAVSAFALPSNTLKFTLGEKSVSVGEESAEMNGNLLKSVVTQPSAHFPYLIKIVGPCGNHKIGYFEPDTHIPVDFQ